MKGFTSTILHVDDEKADVHGALRPPIYDCSSFGFSSSETIAAAFDGSQPAHAYSRVSNPTVESFEKRIAAMANAHGVVAVASGMAAITNVVLALCESGTTIVASKFLFGNTIGLFEKTFKPWGLNIRWVDPANIEEIASAVDNTTRMVFVETISNPQIVIVDVAKIAKVCAEKNIPLVLDNSLATSYLLRSVDYGAALEIVSAAKFISGGGTSIGGLIIDNGVFDWNSSPRIKEMFGKWGKDSFVRTLRSSVSRNVGACLAPQSAYLQTLGLETLALRIDRSSENACKVAEFLLSNKKIAKVNYPGISQSKYFALSQKQFRKGYCGGLLSFELSDEVPYAKFLDELKLVKRSSNFNDNKSLVIHPASTLFYEYSKEQRCDMKINDSLIRLSVGIEDVDDIIEDLSNALASC